MNYYINIIDTTDATHTTIVEKAAAKSIVLSHKGKDAKDELAVIGSTLSFTMEVPHDNNVDGAFLHLFTGDETKYKIELKKESDDTLLWSGFLLPDSYSEPYTQGNFFVDFVATDGLGRLKGKYLPDAFYTDEKTVTEIICKCLELTGLQLDLYFRPGIQNTSQNLYHNLYLDGLDFVSTSGKKDDAYKILQTLLEDTLSCCFQANNRFNIEGLNIRNLLTFTTQHYNYDATYVGEVEVTRLVKNISNITLQTPTVTMVAPYNTITVTHDRDPQAFPETIYKESGEGVALLTGVNGQINATDWSGNNGCYAYALAPDFEVGTFPNGTLAFDATKYINLKEKIYLDVDTKIRIKLTCQYDTTYYDIVFDGNIIFSNRTGDVTDEETLTGSTDAYSITVDYITQTEGLLDVKIYQQLGTAPHDIFSISTIKELSITVLGFSEEYEITDTISDEYTINKDVQLTFADDKSGYSKAFQLAKLRETTTSYNDVSVPILYGFDDVDGNHYSVVSLEGANLIKDNINTVYRSAVLLTDLEVIYNYQSGEEMVVKTTTAYTTGDFDVRVYKIDDYTTSRATWEQWTDAVYEVESLRYAKAIANIMRRLFVIPHQKVDVTVEAAIKFDDIIKWQYLTESNYVVTNCSWNLDVGETTITIVRNIYQNDDVITPGDNIPPIVDAGEDIYINTGVTTANLDATAYDPDGFIAAYLWNKLSGTGGAITTPLAEDTALTGLTGDEYEYKITVTDDDGATASDTVKIFRVKDYTISLVELSCTTPEPDTAQLVNKECTYQVQISPDLPAGFTLQLEGNYELTNTNNDEQYLFSQAKMTITKGDGVSTTTLEETIAYENETHLEPFTVNYIDGNDIRFIGYLKVEDEDPPLSEDPAVATAEYTINLTTATFISGFGNILGLTDTETENISL